MPDKKDTGVKRYDENGKRIRTSTGGLNPSRRRGRARNPGWNSRKPRQDFSVPNYRKG